MFTRALINKISIDEIALLLSINLIIVIFWLTNYSFLL
jgi:hypothetical protein